MKASVQLLILLVFALLLLLAGRRWGVSSVDVYPQTDTVYVDKPLPSRDTIRVEVPRTHVVYRTVRDTVRIEVPVPRGFSPNGLIPRNPLRFDRRHAVLTYWSPSSSAFVQDRYEIPKRKTGAYLAARGVLWPDFGLGVEMGARWRMLGVFASADAYRESYHVTAGIRLYALGR